VPKLLLHAHPDHPSPVARIEVELARTADRLSLAYSIFGDMDAVSIPPARSAARADGLWKQTCLEAFLAAGPGYYEFNFSPSGQWAVYRFDAYRDGMRDAATHKPVIDWSIGKGIARLVATLPLPSGLTGGLGLSAIIEDTSGNRSFWALAHPPGAPDFHHPACFAASLPPAAQIALD
jgi:hypothetical protein